MVSALSTGCQTGTSGISVASTASGPVIGVPSSTSAALDSVVNFGDSITCGYYALPNDGVANVYSTQGYAGLLDTAIGKPAKNLCRAGDQAADMARIWVYPNSRPALGGGQLFSVMIGTNDANLCGDSAGCLANYLYTVTASLTWLAMPDVDKVLGSAVTNRSGSWSADLGFGLDATGPNATLSFPVEQKIAGRLLYLAYRIADLPADVGGSAVLAVDGVSIMSLTTNPNSGHVLLTQNGTNDSIAAVTVPIGGVGTHTISLTTTSANTANFSFLWAGVPSVNYAGVAGAPRVLVGGIPTTGSAEVNQRLASYNVELQQLVSGLAANGLQIGMAPTANALDGANDMSDTLHPNGAGHIKLAQAFAGVL